MTDDRRETALSIRDVAAELAAESSDPDVRRLARSVATLAGLVWTVLPVKP